MDALLAHENGVLSAATAFGKTVIGAKLISSRKVNTLVLVHRQQLLSQWREKREQFLIINESLSEPPKRRGRKKEQNLIGYMGSGKSRLSSIVDVAVMQSINTQGEVSVIKPKHHQFQKRQPILFSTKTAFSPCICRMLMIP